MSGMPYYVGYLASEDFVDQWEVYSVVWQGGGRAEVQNDAGCRVW